MDNPDTDNIGHIRHRTKKTEEAVKNGQSRDTDNIGLIRHRTKKLKRQSIMDNPETLTTLILGT
jgi:hypothetical protein